MRRFCSRPRVRWQRPNAISPLKKAPRLAFGRLGRPPLVEAAASAERLLKWVMRAGDAHAQRLEMRAEKRQSIRYIK